MPLTRFEIASPAIRRFRNADTVSLASAVGGPAAPDEVSSTGYAITNGTILIPPATPTSQNDWLVLASRADLSHQVWVLPLAAAVALRVAWSGTPTDPTADSYLDCGSYLGRPSSGNTVNVPVSSVQWETVDPQGAVNAPVTVGAASHLKSSRDYQVQELAGGGQILAGVPVLHFNPVSFLVDGNVWAPEFRLQVAQTWSRGPVNGLTPAFTIEYSIIGVLYPVNDVYYSTIIDDLLLKLSNRS